MKLDEKVIQIAMNQWSVTILTNQGRVFCKDDISDNDEEWIKIELPEN